MRCASAGELIGQAPEWNATTLVVGSGKTEGVMTAAARKLETGAGAANASLWERYRSGGDMDARAQLLQQYVPLVYFVARQLSARMAAVELEELVSAGNLGLIRALEVFDLSRGLAFTTYAVPRIRGAILDDLRRRDWMPRSGRARARRLLAARTELAARHQRPATPAEVAQELGLDLTAYWRWCDELAPVVRTDAQAVEGSARERGMDAAREPATSPHHSPDHDLLQEENKAELRKAVGRLPERERSVLALCYFEELTMKEVAAVLRVTESRVCQIRQRALKRLKEGLAPSQDC
jgi:RNA polymerase sigma factor for flagellar operon FliA